MVKYVYTIVSDEGDTYLEQLLISVYSLRLYHPKAVVEIVTDSQTNETIKGKRQEIRKYVSKINPIVCPVGYNKMRRSRFLKTNLRKFVEGDYLFIDCDTIICNSLEQIEDFHGELGMVADTHGDLALDDIKVIDRCKQAGFNKVEGKPYFNSGIIYAKDTPFVHQFYDEWYKLWVNSDSRGVSYDQPALCQANINYGLPIKELPGIWNCQIKCFGYPYLEKAKIIHYYSNNGNGERSYSQDRIFEYAKEKGCIDTVLDNIIRSPKTIFYTAVTVTPDKAFEFFYSEMLYYFFSIPPLYRMAKFFSKVFKTPVLFISKLKNLV